MQLANRFNTIHRHLERLHVQLRQLLIALEQVQGRKEQALAQGHHPDSFLMRRFESRCRELQKQFEDIRAEMNHLLSYHFERRFLFFASPYEVEEAMRLRTRLRGLNSLCPNELPVAAWALAKLNQTLPTRLPLQ